MVQIDPVWALTEFVHFWYLAIVILLAGLIVGLVVAYVVVATADEPPGSPLAIGEPRLADSPQGDGLVDGLASGSDPRIQGRGSDSGQPGRAAGDDRDRG